MLQRHKLCRFWQSVRQQQLEFIRKRVPFSHHAGSDDVDLQSDQQRWCRETYTIQEIHREHAEDQGFGQERKFFGKATLPSAEKDTADFGETK